MTKIAGYRELCEHCTNKLLLCEKCGKAKFQGTKFSKWLRNLDKPYDSTQFVAHNLDYIWFNYKQNWLITLEEKRMNGTSSDSQKQIHNLISQMLEYASGNEFDISFGNKKQIAKINYKGHFIIQFEKESPEDSKWIKINEKKGTDTELYILLLTGKLNSKQL